LKPQTVDRELNIIVAMLNKGDAYFPQLDQTMRNKETRRLTEAVDSS
jgi:hypothetical protein